MALSEQDIRGIAAYARIHLTEDELGPMTKYMNDIVSTLECVRTMGLDAVEPTFHPIGELANVMRDDELGASLSHEEALKNAAQTEGRYFKVPTILALEE